MLRSCRKAIASDHAPGALLRLSPADNAKRRALQLSDLDVRITASGWMPRATSPWWMRPR